MKLNTYQNADEAIAAIAVYFVELAKTSIAKQKRFSVSLSGGSSPKKLYELLANDYAKAVDWEKVYFFFGDERYVAHDHADSNFRMANNALFVPLNINEKQIFKLNTSLTPEEAASEYETNIREHFNQNTVFDLVLLGLGDDAHTASLFPGTSIISVKDALVKEVYVEDKDVYRISMTAPLINQAANIAFLTFGESKANAIKSVLEEETDVNKYPAQLIKPVNGEVQWFVDKAAVSKLTKK